jgi:hypothetical protein
MGVADAEADLPSFAADTAYSAHIPYYLLLPKSFFFRLVSLCKLCY